MSNSQARLNQMVASAIARRKPQPKPVRDDAYRARLASMYRALGVKPR